MSKKEQNRKINFNWTFFLDNQIKQEQQQQNAPTYKKKKIIIKTPERNFEKQQRENR